MLSGGEGSGGEGRENGSGKVSLGLERGDGLNSLTRDGVVEKTLGDEGGTIEVAEKDQADLTRRRCDGVEAIIVISFTGDGGGGVSGVRVCIVVDGDMGLFRYELKEAVLDDDGYRLTCG
jgi:hypothetical protein